VPLFVDEPLGSSFFPLLCAYLQVAGVISASIHPCPLRARQGPVFFPPPRPPPPSVLSPPHPLFLPNPFPSSIQAFELCAFFSPARHTTCNAAVFFPPSPFQVGLCSSLSFFAPPCLAPFREGFVARPAPRVKPPFFFFCPYPPLFSRIFVPSQDLRFLSLVSGGGPLG